MALARDQLTLDQWKELEQRLSTWATQHPHPKEATLVFMGRDYSPADILDEVRERSELGTNLATFLYEAAKRLGTSVEAIIDRAILWIR